MLTRILLATLETLNLGLALAEISMNSKITICVKCTLLINILYCTFSREKRTSHSRLGRFTTEAARNFSGEGQGSCACIAAFSTECAIPVEALTKKSLLQEWNGSLKKKKGNYPKVFDEYEKEQM